MKKNCLCATLFGFWAALGWAQTTEELVNDGKNTENVTTQEHGLRPEELQSAPANQ